MKTDTRNHPELRERNDILDRVYPGQAHAAYRSKLQNADGTTPYPGDEQASTHPERGRDLQADPLVSRGAFAVA